MKQLGKANICYLIGLAVLSIVQLCLIRGLMTSEGITAGGQLIVDGSDFTPLISLAVTGVNAFVYTVSIGFDMLIGAVLSLIAMRLLRRFTLHLFPSDIRTVNTRLTLIAGIICLLIGFALSRFRALFDVFLIYAPVPLTAWLAYHLGKRPDGGSQ